MSFWNNLQRSVNFDVTVSASAGGGALIRVNTVSNFLGRSVLTADKVVNAEAAFFSQLKYFNKSSSVVVLTKRQQLAIVSLPSP